MVDTKPVTDRVPLVGPDGRLTMYGLDVLRGFERAIGGPGSVTLSSSEISGSGENELASFTADGDLQNTGMLAVSGTLTLTGNIVAADAVYPGKIERFEAAVNQASLSGAGQVVLLDAAAGEQWKIMEIMISGTGTNFSGGDRLLDIKQDTTVYSTITTTLLQTLASTRWGGTGLPLPTDLFAQTASGQDVIAQYSGGLTDYTAGECTISLVAAKL